MRLKKNGKNFTVPEISAHTITKINFWKKKIKILLKSDFVFRATDVGTFFADIVYRAEEDCFGGIQGH